MINAVSSCNQCLLGKTVGKPRPGSVCSEMGVLCKCAGEEGLSLHLYGIG